MTDLGPNETRPELEQRHSDDPTDPGSLADLSQIEAAIAADFALLGVVIDDLGDLPGDASVRMSGLFDDPKAAQQWLDDGGLVAYDATGSPTPGGLVYFYRVEDEDTGEFLYQIYIKDESV